MSLKIGDIAHLSGVSAKTIRYYESVGLLKLPARADNGYRIYTPDTARTLRFVRHARGLGFSLDEVRALLALWQDQDRPSREVKALAQKRIEEIDARILELTRLRAELSTLAGACHGDHRPECPILDALGPPTTTEESS
ncbi:MAG: MerR family copper efflux transcriptional regulator [Myxococcota bacterium]|jgi:MerR family copper efflux transcriptional regulator